MDGTRARRTRDRARRAWYAGCRQYRFARHYGFVNETVVTPDRGPEPRGSPDFGGGPVRSLIVAERQIRW